MRQRRQITGAEGLPVLVQAEAFVANIKPFVVLARSALHIGIVNGGKVKAVVISPAEYKRLVKIAKLPSSRRSLNKG